ncbi:uncharacterized protein LOC117550433 [Gymnodraco acuticeps]|uniref:Uncharacterized protein LOC117550433 n=1 Tax=Gymnodraco acuticeps TaxID=8218 RepID=A0A6P8UN27_GYMAC|nr:uncharacterized protein LOC117550433 [Gymnodraco acuticeps]
MNYPAIPAQRFIDLDAITSQCVEILCAGNPNVWLGHGVIEILGDEVYSTDRGSVYQNFFPEEFIHNPPFEVTADPWGPAVALPRDSDNQTDSPLFNTTPQQQQQQPISETFLQIPPELQADFDTCSAYLDDFELHPVQDTLLTSQTDSPLSPRVEGEPSAQNIREIQAGISLVTDPLLTRYHPDQSSYYQGDQHCCYCHLYGHTY